MSDEKRFSPKEDVTLLLKKGKRGLFRVLFSRAVIIVFLLLLQIAFFFLAFLHVLGDNLFLLLTSNGLLSLICTVIIVNDHHMNPTVKLTWIVQIMLFPIFSIPFYLFITQDLGYRLVRRQLRNITKETKPFLAQDEQAVAALDEGSQSLAHYMWREANAPVYRHSDAHYFPVGEEAFEEMLRQLESAETFIFLEYFIIEEGYMWGRILNILKRKAAQGVEVRVLYDGTCAMTRLPYSYPKKLETLGIRCKMFAPVRVAVSTHYNNRDHRKILVIDGKTAFTGGINLSDEYINRKKRFGHWKDNAVMVTGEAVRSFTLMFLQMWNVEALSGEDYQRYLSVEKEENAKGAFLPFGSSPFDTERVGEMLYMDMINRARRYVHIMTPYLIIDNEMATALTFAARRGVEVVVLMPHIPDKKAVFDLAKTYYPQLLSAGVKIYEYTPGFIHSKLLVSDDKRSVVGTVNFDYRSLYHHFECALYMEDTPAVAAVERDVLDTMAQSQRVTFAQWRSRSLKTKLVGRVLRLMAPLL